MCSVCCEKGVTYNFLTVTIYSLDIHDEMHHRELSSVLCWERILNGRG